MVDMTVEVAYALPDKQKIIALTVPEGTIALDAVIQSNIVDVFPEIDPQTAKMGIFGKAIKPKNQVLKEGDRVEIYRPLLSDPKATRKARAEKAKAKKEKS
ncbi:MAG: RnfH family protein [Cellvibrionales bacterium]|nr:RnfH family protein [Cellvibrionales bacterium]